MTHKSDYVVCPAKSCGYTCIRPKDHGMLHVSPEQVEFPNTHGNGWVRWPHGPEEAGLTVPDWTGYLLVNDALLLVVPLILPEAKQ